MVSFNTSRFDGGRFRAGRFLGRRQALPAAPTTVLVIVAGQSNARKAGTTGQTPNAKYSGLSAQIWDRAGGTWAVYNPATNSGDGGTLDGGAWGSELEFLYQLKQEYPDCAVYIVKEAVNGQNLAQVAGGDWSPDSAGERFEGLEAQMTAARAALSGAGITDYQELTLWNQGEADSNTIDLANAYQANLEGFLTAYRSRISTGTFIIERIRPRLDGSGSDAYTRCYTVREAMETVAANDGTVRIISTDFTPSNFTILHPDPAWCEGCGLRGYASWRGTYAVTYGAISDGTPSNLSFTNQVDVATSTVVSSNSLAIAGINGHGDVSITGGEYRVLNPDDTTFIDWTSAAGTIHPGQKLQLRQTSSASLSAQASTTVTVGGASTTWAITTYASAPSYESETQAFISKVAANGGGSISGADADALDAFYVAAKGATWWPKMLKLYLRLGDEIASSLDLVGQSVSLEKVVSSGLNYTWNATTGFTPADNSNAGIDLKVNPSTELPQDSASIILWYSALAASTRSDLNGGAEIYLRALNTGAVRYNLNSAANSNASGLTTTPGMRAIVRSGASAIAFHGPTGAIINSSNAASASPTGAALYLGNPSGTFDGTASFFGAGAANAAITETEMQDIYSKVNTLLNAFAP